MSKSKLLAVAALALFSLSAATPAFAGGEEENKKGEIVYLGNLNDLPVYRLSLSNENNETYFISITDNNGNVIYSERLKGKNIVRNYQLDSETFGSEYDFNVEVTNLNDKSVNVYNISKTTNLVEQVAVNKIK